ncbi:MAG: C39 family peptidase [Lachnospiraceae bacterium]|nr:C39 family peptidase [Lachnospiraceae bacterium]
MNSETQEIDVNQEQKQELNPEQNQKTEQDQQQIQSKTSGNLTWTGNLTSILAGALLVFIVVVGVVLVMNGLPINAKETADENAAETAQETTATDALTAQEAALTLGEDSLLEQGESAQAAVTGENAEEDDAVQKESEENTASEGTNLLDDFVDKYGTVIPKNMTDSECIEALAELAEQYPEFEEIYENWEDYPILLLVALCNNPEMIDFALGYPDADTETAGELTEAEVNSDFPYYLQWDSRWGYLSYGVSDIGLSGCGPTCLSMVIVKLTQNAEASPAAVAEYAMEHGYYIKGSGTAWSLMTTGAAHFGITGKALSSSTSEADLKALLEDGYPIICSVKQGDFTKGGHFIVLAGVEDGQIRVYDPNSVERSSRLWDYETLKKQIKKMWVYEAAE